MRGRIDILPIIALCVIVLILLAGFLIILEAFSDDETEQELEELRQNLSEISTQVELEENKKGVEEFQRSIQTSNDCVGDETFSVELNRCVRVCKNCTSSIKDVYTAYLSERTIDFDEKRYVTFGAHSLDNTWEYEPSEVLIPQSSYWKYQRNESYTQDVLLYVTSLLPLHLIDNFEKINYVTDFTKDSILAITQTGGMYTVSLDIVEVYEPTHNYTRLAPELIEAYGEMFFYDFEQIQQKDIIRPLSKEEQKIIQKICPNNFMTPYGCMKTGAYLNDFYQKFWVKIHKDRLDRSPILFYGMHQDKFISEQAAHSPLDDLLITWVHFVLSERPDGLTVGDDKILFLYEYPELERARDWMRANIAPRDYSVSLNNTEILSN